MGAVILEWSGHPQCHHLGPGHNGHSWAGDQAWPQISGILLQTGGLSDILVAGCIDLTFYKHDIMRQCHHCLMILIWDECVYYVLVAPATAVIATCSEDHCSVNCSRPATLNNCPHTAAGRDMQ